MSPREHRPARAGVAYGLAAYLAWGVVPIYFKSVAGVAPLEVLAHRILWSLLLLATLLTLGRRWGEVAAVLRRRRTLAALAGSTILIALNWYTFIWAVGHDRILQSSFGYFVNPLVNAALGVVFLRERLRRPQAAGVALATAGVVWLGLSYGQVPGIALVLAFSFGFYGLLRKTVAAGPLAGLAIETALLAPAALLLLWRLEAGGRLAFGRRGTETDLLLAAAGLVTAVPLLWFAAAARRLRLVTVGFLQYLSPSLQLLLAVLVYGEAFGRDHLVSFGLIWAALAIYSLDAWRSARVSPLAAGRSSPRG